MHYVTFFVAVLLCNALAQVGEDHLGVLTDFIWLTLILYHQAVCRIIYCVYCIIVIILFCIFFSREQHQTEMSAMDDKVKCLELEIEKTKKSSYETTVQFETKVGNLKTLFLDCYFFHFNHAIWDTHLFKTTVQGNLATSQEIVKEK